MRKGSRQQLHKVVGSGLVALDIVLDGEKKAALAAGGTCANVVAALSYLGWHSVLVARLGDDYAAKTVLNDLAIFGVDTKFSTLKPVSNTPVIVERLRADRHGRPFHTFSFSCPSCGKRLPSFQPVTSAQQLESLPEIVADTNVCFIDRISRGAIDLAEAVSAEGGVVYFEPSSVRDEKLFREMMRHTSIIKYSHERLTDEGEIRWTDATLLEIQTLGRGGVRFRFREHSQPSNWHHCDALPLPKLVDSCGAGDWFSAGLIHWLCSSHSMEDKSLTPKVLTDAMNFAQRVAIWTCGFPGARGGMYSERGRATLRSLIRLKRPLQHSAKPESDQITAKICGCEVAASTLHHAMHQDLGSRRLTAKKQQGRGSRMTVDRL